MRSLLHVAVLVLPAACSYPPLPVVDVAGIDAPGMTSDANVADAVIRLDASLCGDGQVETAAGEACDDGNTSACGTCSADCTRITSSGATGEIIAADAVGTNIMDGDTFRLIDGIKVNAFEFNNSGGVEAGNIPIQFALGDTAEMVADAIFLAIHNKGTTAITATFGATNSTIVLTNGRATSLGNQTIDRTGGIATSFTFIGMSGGQGGDCDSGVGCKTGDDCIFGVCNSMGQCN
jgi:cysteine-rich repeat protein